MQEPAVPAAAEPIRVLIVDGQNNHGVWPQTTAIMQQILEDSGIFTVEVARTAREGVDPGFHPEFSRFDVVVSNYNGADWTDGTQQSFEKFVSEGGGFVVVHAADNAFPDWLAYNQMIGLGGWGGRSEKSGPWLYLDADGNPVRDEAPGGGGSHGAQHEFLVETRSAEHPVMRGLPPRWLHAQDELYDRLRGPAANIEILATAFSDPATGGSGRHEPMLMAIKFGQGRVFHMTLGHAEYSMQCAGFAAILQRSAEWVATGEVKQPVPERFPTEGETVRWWPRKGPEQAAIGNMPNAWRYGDIILASQPEEADFPELRKLGVKQAISLRQTRELAWDDAAVAEANGMKLERFPVSSPESLSDELLDQIRSRLSAASPGKPLLLYCGKAVRVGAVWAAWRAIDCQIDLDTAIQEGIALGMTAPGLQQRVREHVQARTADGNNPAQDPDPTGPGR